MPDNFNISLQPTVPVVPKVNTSGSASHANQVIKQADKPVTRNIAPLTEYNNETGNLDVSPRSPWGVSSEVETVKTEPEVVAETKVSSTERQAQWKADQAAKKQKVQEKRVEKQAKQQVLAKDLLLKGDLVGAASALGMTPSEFATYVDNARLQIPNKVEELTPEQKRVQDDENFRKDRLVFEQEQKNFKYQVIASNYIKDNIDPVLADKDKFEFIHKYDVGKVKNFVYEYMNKHYVDTGEELKASDVLETIENQMYETHKSSLESLRGMKKVSSFFAPVTRIEDDNTEVPVSRDSKVEPRKVSMEPDNYPFKEPTLANKTTRSLDSRFPTRDTEVDDMIAEAEEEEARVTQTSQAVRRSANSGNNTPFALLSREERLARMKSER